LGPVHVITRPPMAHPLLIQLKIQGLWTSPASVRGWRRRAVSGSITSTTGKVDKSVKDELTNWADYVA
jgi:hypothetical protein